MALVRKPSQVLRLHLLQNLVNHLQTDNDIKTIANQQNECQGNIVICQNILTKFICTERAVCIIGNLDPFLLVLPN